MEWRNHGYGAFKLPDRIWVPTFKCGCGNCRFGDRNTKSKRKKKECPNKDSPKAIMLWTSVPR